MGKQVYSLRYNYSKHDKITRWLFEHASIRSVEIENASNTSVEDMDYWEDGMITLRVPIDEVTY